MSTKNRLIAHQILAEKRRRRRVSRIVKCIMGKPKDMRYRYLKTLRALAAEGFQEAKAALQAVYIEDNRAWWEWDTDPIPSIDPYTGEDDDAGYIVIGPDQYLEFAIPEEEGGGVERIGYKELVWLFDLLNEEPVICGPLTQQRIRVTERSREVLETITYTPEQASSLVQSSLGPYQDFPEEQPEEDRGYVPPTFTPSIELNWGDVEAWARQHKDELDAITDGLFESLYSLNQRIQEARQNLRKAGIHERALIAEAISKLPPVRASAPDLEALLLSSDLTHAERYHIMRRVVGMLRQRIPEDAMAEINKRGSKAPSFFKYLFALQFSRRLEELVEQSHLSWFVELFEEELETADSPGYVDEMPDWIIEREADQALEAILSAPVIKLPRKELETLWRSNRSAFPAPTQVHTSTRRDITSFWLADQADWRTLQKLYQLAGIEIEGAAIHSHTPFFQRRAIEKIAAGIPTHIAYKQTWAEYREKLAERRAQPAKLKPAQNTVEITGFNAEKERFVGEAHGKPVLLHPDALDKAPIALTERTLQVLQKFVEQYPSAKKLVLKAQPT